MGKVEKTRLQDTINGLVFYVRYVDNIFCLADDATDTEDLVQKFNSAHPSLKFIAEAEADSEIALLDVHLRRQEDGSIQRRVFRKKTWTGEYVNFHSLVPLNIKRNLVQGLTARVRRICLPEAIEEEPQQLQNTLRENEYPDRFILRNIEERATKPTVATAEKKEQGSFFVSACTSSTIPHWIIFSRQSSFYTSLEPRFKRLDFSMQKTDILLTSGIIQVKWDEKNGGQVTCLTEKDS
ncbi:hypothetical protein SprV_0301229400 [Sparganum proliferum]